MKSARLVLDDFCLKQFQQGAGNFINFDKQLFTAKCNEAYSVEALKPGYAPFCKHLFMPNFTETVSGYVKITEENAQYLCSGYEARRENELAVLS